MEFILVLSLVAIGVLGVYEIINIITGGDLDEKVDEEGECN